jgi:hypothetical protein
MRSHAERLGLEFNAKTQIVPLSEGVKYLGWHTYLTASGAVVRRLDSAKKRNLRRQVKGMAKAYADGTYSVHDVQARLASLHGHLTHGNAAGLQTRILGSAIFRRAEGEHRTISSLGQPQNHGEDIVSPF